MTRVTLAGVPLKNCVMNASGTFSRESAAYVDVNAMGLVVTKGVSMEPWPGSAPPRIAETYGGMLNAIGLQNPGVEYFLREELPFWKRFGTPVMVNLAGHTVDEYMAVAGRLADAPADLLELNISCPNVDRGGIVFGTDPATVQSVTQAVKRAARQPLVVKLSPNVTDIAAVARAAEAGGADALSLINTLMGMRIDIAKRRPVLARGAGGLSGPAVKPVALRQVYEVCGAVNIPVIGMGGVATAEDALEFIMAGATAVAVGTAQFANPRAVTDIAEGIAAFLRDSGCNSVDEIRGAARCYSLS